MALGIGILMGISMGDSTLVFNQIAVIEELEGKIHSYRQRNEEITFHADELQYQLERWDILKERYMQPLFEDTLVDYSVTLIAGEDYPAEVIKLLEQTGCSYRAFYLTAPEQWKYERRINTTFQDGASGVDKYGTFSFGEIFWEAIHHQDEMERDELLFILKDYGLLEEKRYAAKASVSMQDGAVNGQDIYLLTGDIPFVISVLRQGMGHREDDFIWIALNSGFAEEVNKSFQLPGNWTVINDGATFFSRVELWEVIKQFSVKDY